MTITYDVDMPIKNGKHHEEYDAIKIFLASKHKNVCFTYDSDKEAKQIQSCIRDWKRKNNLLDVFDMMRRDKCIYITRKKKG